MPAGDIINGFVPGIVTQRETGPGGCVKVEIPGILKETPYWVMPAGWPGAGGATGTGSRYPAPPIGAQVFVMFSHGIYSEPDSQAIYLTGYYGENADGSFPGPTTITEEGLTQEQQRERVSVWEDDNFSIDVTNEPNNKNLTLQTKNGTKIQIEAAGGDSGVSETVIIESRTAISLYTKGLCDIQATVLQLNGRRVAHGGGMI
jgi:hypothetical protein